MKIEDTKLQPEQRDVFFHLHLDSSENLSNDVRIKLKNQGFYKDDFDGVPEGSSNVAPEEHWSQVYAKREGAKWRADALWLTAFLDQQNITAYRESESITAEYRFDNYADNPSSKVPSPETDLKFKTLNDDQQFKQAELHIEMARSSNLHLQKMLEDIGMLPIYWSDQNTSEVIFTIQGTKEAIQTFETRIIDYILAVGGAKDCHIIKEVIPKDGYSFHGAFNYQDLPDILYDVN